MRIATLNTWHGLDGVGLMRFGVLETAVEKRARRKRQAAALRALQPQLLLLQEVNPLPFRAAAIARELNLSVCYGTANVGLKFGWGPPFNLNEGLCVLAPPSWKLERIGTHLLSGGMSFSPFRFVFIHNPFFGFQLKEARSAFAVRVHRPQECGGGTLLVLVTHLHHAPAHTPRNDALLAQSREEGLTPKEEAHIEVCLKRADDRRTAEVQALLKWVQKLARPGEDVLLGGDFNCEAGSRPQNLLKEAGYEDLWDVGGGDSDFTRSATWDPPHNPLAYRVQGFEQPGADFSGKVGEFFRRTDMLPRRIDFLLYKKASGKTLVKKVGRFGWMKQAGAECVPDEFAALEKRKPYEYVPADDLSVVSDHFGIYADL